MNLRILASLAVLASSVVVSSCSKEAGGNTPPSSVSGRGGSGRGNPGRGGRFGFPPDRPIPVEIQIVALGTVSRTSTIAGVLEPIRTVGVNSQLSGVLLSIRVEEGSRVRRGQVLAEIDATELQAQARSAEASLNFARSTFERSQQLFDQKIITAAEFERDRAAFESARASLDQLRTRLGYATVLAPLDGIVTEKRAEAGDVVGTQTRLFAVADVSMLVTRVQVSELEVQALQQGDTVHMTVDALGGAAVSGRIRRVFPAADSSTRLVPVEVALTGRALDQLRPGYTVRATFRLDQRDNALLIPSRAVSGPVGSRAVYVVSEGKIARRAVRVGQDLEGRIEVLDGLVQGDSVIVSGSSMLREGALARVVAPLGDPSSSRPVSGRDTLRMDSTPNPANGGSTR